MIAIVEGFGVGAGKTYFATVQLVNHFVKGGTAFVADTLCIKWDALKDYVARKYGLALVDSQFREVDSKHIMSIHEHTGAGTADCPVLVVVDECHGSLNARDWADKSKRSLFDWATQSRHDDNDLLFISQSALNIDKQLRRIATYNWRIRNSECLGDSNALRHWLRVWRFISFGLNGGPMFIVNQLDQDGRTPLGKKQFIPHDKEIFAIYDSKAMRGRHKRTGEEIGKVTLAKISRVSANKKATRPIMKYLAIFILLAIAGGVYVVYKTDWSFGHSKGSPVAAVVASASPAPSASIPKDKLGDYDIIKTRMIASAPGYLKTPDGEYFVGEMAGEGFVEAIRGRRALLQQPNGRKLYIVAEDWVVPPKAFSSDATTTTRQAAQSPGYQGLTAPVKH